MKRISLALLVILVTACTHGGHSGAQPATTSTLAPRLSDASASARCRSALPGRVILNSIVLAPGAVAEMKNLHVRGTTTTVAADSDVAVWCWTGRPNNYNGYAIGSRGEVLFTQTLGPEYNRTPAPGPAPMH